MPIGFLASYLTTIAVGFGLCVFVASQTGSVVYACIAAAITGLVGGFAFARSLHR